MAFEPGHEKRGGRKAGTPNKRTAEAREIALRLVGRPEYLASLEKRLSEGLAPRIELRLWEVALGRPRIESEPPEAPDPSGDLLQILEELGDPLNKVAGPPRAVSQDSDEVGRGTELGAPGPHDGRN
jgi:hypothetical protein